MSDAVQLREGNHYRLLVDRPHRAMARKGAVLRYVGPDEDGDEVFEVVRHPSQVLIGDRILGTMFCISPSSRSILEPLADPDEPYPVDAYAMERGDKVVCIKGSDEFYVRRGKTYVFLKLNHEDDAVLIDAEAPRPSALWTTDCTPRQLEEHFAWPIYAR